MNYIQVYARVCPDSSGTGELGQRSQDFPGLEDAFIFGLQGEPGSERLVFPASCPPGGQAFLLLDLVATLSLGRKKVQSCYPNNSKF